MSLNKADREKREKYILKLLKKKPDMKRKEISDRCLARFGAGVRWDTLFILKQQQLKDAAAGVKVVRAAKPVLPTTSEPKTNWRPDRTPPGLEQGRRPAFRQIAPRSFFAHSCRQWVYMKLLIPTAEGFNAVILDAASDSQEDIGTLVTFGASTPVEVLEFEFVYPEEK